ncbi:MAG: type II CRISPR-associated endonuclease Cas1 [Clostridia bacterium]|nr:type II CRISPR-associated endonuclease Cas1 [Clostridia bacterium]
MAFRTILIESRCKLEYSLNYMICRKGNEETRILIDEIRTIVIDSTQVSITSSLISECLQNKIKIIFCDSKHNPIGEIIPYQNNYYSYRKIKEQLNFPEKYKNDLWDLIVKEKIVNQARNLEYKKHTDSFELLKSYLLNISDGDETNREGHAAKVYFNSLFGNDFSREQDNNVNKYLNYGYSLLLSCINREIKSLGYLTELGIHHIGESNPFNLSCDFIEPLRPLVDYTIISEELSEDNWKEKILDIINSTVEYNSKEFILSNAIHLYVEDLFNYLKTGNKEKIRFIKYEL